MENKYYTPDISEFHVGFEYEQLVGSGHYVLGQEAEPQTYQKCKFPDPFLGCAINKLNLDSIRVKLLDKEDIERLGWNIVQDNFNNDGILHFEHSYMEGYFGRLTYSNNYLFLSNGYIHLFNGTIKNKSELKRLMIQLGIK